ncbi:MAG: hypothetical protein QOJ29_3199, partial [Thermoleophilaceae bacterium]|nr:hypothetical protein [Thermoleophilaceae bacterium]
RSTRPRRSDPRDIREGAKTRAVMRRDARVRRALAVADILAAVLALGGAFATDTQEPRPALVLAPVLIVLFCKVGGLYDRDEHVIRKSTLDQAPELAQVATMFVLLVWLADGVFVRGGFTKAEVALAWPLLVVALVVLRSAARRLAAHTATAERLLLLGSAEPFTKLQSRLAAAHSLSAVLIGRLPLDHGDREPPEPLGGLADLDYVIRVHGIERVIIAPSDRTPDEQLDTIRLVKSLGVKVSVLPRLFEVVGSSMEFDDVDGITLLGLRRYGLSRTSWYLKRAFDLIVATLGVVISSPLLAAIALAIKATSPGPVFFRQARVGRRGKPFRMFKFRTMYDGADEDKATLRAYCDSSGLFKLAEDPRVTAVGRVLRRTSLDELPQLFNVVRADMSLVGPRPLIEEEDRKIAGWHHRRREGTPGMTGVWQLLGSARVPLDDMVKMDYLYRANWSLWLDMKILLRTAVHVLNRRGL